MDRSPYFFRLPTMLEIILLFVCGKKIAEICNRKNRAAWPWVVMMIAFYFGGAIAAAVVATILTMVNNPNAEDLDLGTFLVCYLVAAVISLGLSFVIVSALPDAGRGYDEDDEFEDRPRRRPARRRREVEESDDRLRDDRPRRYGGRGEADEDDDRFEQRRSDERERY